MMEFIHTNKYNVLILPTADGYWSWQMSFGGYPTLAYGDVNREKTAYLDVLFGVLVLAWKHSLGESIQKKWGKLPGIDRA